LPLARFERRHLLRQLTGGGEDERPGQFGRGVGRRAGMLAGRNDDAEPRTGLDVDMRIDAALADQFELWQSVQKRGCYLCALADQHQAFGVSQTIGEHVAVLHVIVPDFYVVTLQLVKTRKGPQRVEIIVKDGNIH
jgi:hypothetical protein